MFCGVKMAGGAEYVNLAYAIMAKTARRWPLIRPKEAAMQQRLMSASVEPVLNCMILEQVA